MALLKAINLCAKVHFLALEHYENSQCAIGGDAEPQVFQLNQCKDHGHEGHHQKCSSNTFMLVYDRNKSSADISAGFCFGQFQKFRPKHLQ